MATYTDIFALRVSDVLVPLRQKINVALTIKANAIAKSASTTETQKAFALEALKDPNTYQGAVLNYILAEYNTQPVTAIVNATDAQVQTAVNATVDTLLGV